MAKKIDCCFNLTYCLRSNHSVKLLVDSFSNVYNQDSSKNRYLLATLMRTKGTKHFLLKYLKLLQTLQNKIQTSLVSYFLY